MAFQHVGILSIDHLTLYCKAHPRKFKPDYLPVGAIEVGLFTKNMNSDTFPRLQHTTAPRTTGHVAMQVSLKIKLLLLTVTNKWACPQNPTAGNDIIFMKLSTTFTLQNSSKQFDSSGLQHVIEQFHPLTPSSLNYYITLLPRGP